MNKKTKFPIISLMFMIFGYFILGTILVCLPHGEPVIWGMDIPAFIIMYAGYLLVILACVFFIKTDK